MRELYLRTDLSVEDCRGRVAARTGRARLRQKFFFLGWGLGYASDRPLSGRVDEAGFDVSETPEEIGFPDVRVRGAWVRVGSKTVLKLSPRRTFLAGKGIFVIPAVFLLVLFVFYGIAYGSWTAAILCICFYFIFILLGSVVGLLRTGREGRRLAERFAVLFEARSIDDPFEIMEAREAFRRRSPEGALDER